MTAVTHLRRPEIRIKLGWVRRGRILERSIDDSVPHMTSRAGHRFFLILGIVLRIGLLNRFFHSPSWNLFHQCRLLVFQRGVTVQAHPDILVFFPIGLKVWILIGVGMDTRLPFVVYL